MRQDKRSPAVALERLEARVLLSSWPMKGHDIGNTNRADFSVPASRLNASLFDLFAWQTRVPGSPVDGRVSSTSMVFFDGAGPGGADLVAGSYHWPKGVQGMDRHNGKVFWSGNPAGGESIAVNTPAFSNDGATLYVTNDATGSAEFPQGHPLMAFTSANGPSTYRHNGFDADPNLLGSFSPKIAPDGLVLLHAWNDRPYGATDNGAALSETFAASDSLCSCYSNPAAYGSAANYSVVAAGRCGVVKSFDQGGGQTWSVTTGQFTDADPTNDPANGNI
jgi:hypothetical protein